VYGNYLKYISIYAYTILTAYPNYKCEFYTDLNDYQEASKQVSLLPLSMQPNVKIYHSGAIDQNIYRLCCDYQCKAALRWFLPIKTNLEHIYIGDVDFFIVRETMGIGEQHTANAKFLALPFSNAVRHGRRLSGLHFSTKANYVQLSSHMNCDEIERIRTFMENETPHGLDEKILYYLVANAFGDEVVAKLPVFRPYHGFHFAASRQSLAKLLFQDIRHTKPLGAPGWLPYERKELRKHIRSLLLNNYELNTILDIAGLDSVRRFLIFVDTQNSFLRNSKILFFRMPKNIYKVLSLYIRKIYGNKFRENN
jgi:hypothetical protein